MRSLLKIFVCSILIFKCGICLAQTDSSYVEKYNDHIHITPYYGIRLASIVYENEETNEEKTYMPNISSEVGVGVSWRRIGIYTKIYGFPPNSKYGKTSAFDFQGYWYPSRFQISASLQDYRGFYSKSNNIIELRPDLTLKLYRLYGEYLLNNNKFSYRSAYNYDEKQLIPTGTFKIGIGFYYTSLSAIW